MIVIPCAPIPLAVSGNVTFSQLGTEQGSYNGGTWTYGGITSVAGDSLLIIILDHTFAVSQGFYATMSATCDGSSMTQVFDFEPTVYTNGGLTVFAINNPTPGNNNIVVTFAGGSLSLDRGAIIGMTFQGTNSNLSLALPSAGQKGNEASGNVLTNSTAPVPSATGHIVVGVAQGLFANNSPTINFTQKWTSNNATSSALNWTGGITAGAASVTFTMNQNPADQSVVIAFDVSF